MRCVRIAAMAAIAAMAVPASAWATTITSPIGVSYNLGTIKASSNGHTTLHGSGITGPCNVAFEGVVETNGVKHSGLVTTPAGGVVSHLTTFNCTGGYSGTILNAGSYRVTRLGAGLGKVTLSGSEMTMTTPLGFNCLYSTNNTEIGTLRDSSVTGGNAEIEISGTLSRTGHSAFCGSTGTWTGSWTITSPSRLYVD